MKYSFINEQRHEHKVATMCRVLEVARAGFYVKREVIVSHIESNYATEF